MFKTASVYEKLIFKAIKNLETLCFGGDSYSCWNSSTMRIFFWRIKRSNLTSIWAQER